MGDRRFSKGYVHVYTGDGKGKTSESIENDRVTAVEQSRCAAGDQEKCPPKVR